MDFINEILSGQFSVDFVVISLVIAGGYFQKVYWKSPRPDQSIKTLIVSTLFTFTYMLLTINWSEPHTLQETLKNGFVNYALATSFYELIVKHVVDIITNYFDRK